ncbi:GNAT family N-acetyltransferase [Rhizobium sp. RAF56]
MMRLDLTYAPSGDDLKAIGDGLVAFNAADVGPSEKQAIAILIRDDGGAVLGGLYGYTAWGWLFTQWLFVPEKMRGQGVAGRLLDTAEKEAARRGCHGAWIDTFNPQALRAYERQGYEIFGELPEFPKGRSRIFLRKSLVAA